MRRNAEYPRRVPKCQKPRNEKKKPKQNKSSRTARRFICTSILPSTTTGGALYGDCNPSCTRLTALQCSLKVLESPSPAVQGLLVPRLRSRR